MHHRHTNLNLVILLGNLPGVSWQFNALVILYTTWTNDTEEVISAIECIKKFSLILRLIFYYVPNFIYSSFTRGFFSHLILLCLYSPLLDLYTVDRTPWTRDQPVAGPLPKHRTTHTQNKRTHASMPGVGFEPTTPAFERAKTIHVLDRAATVIGIWSQY
jgi:hypothetical protein